MKIDNLRNWKMRLYKAKESQLYIKNQNLVTFAQKHSGIHAI